MDRVIVDTDTASDDAVALALACLTDRLTVEAVTVVAGNVAFDRQVENAKYALSLVDRAEDVPVYEGARSPLVKDFEGAQAVHGEGGLGGDLTPETGIASAEEFAPAEIVARCRAAPGEVGLLCLGPLTNLALALAREPDLPELVDEVWVMGGAVNCQGNVTPAAEFNFWVDPDAALKVIEAFEVALVDWGLSTQAGVVDAATFEAIADADTDLADFFVEATSAVHDHDSDGPGGLVLSDPLATALAAYPAVREAVGTYPATVDERSGLTRGAVVLDTGSVTDERARTHVVESADGDAFQNVLLGALLDRDPDAALS